MDKLERGCLFRRNTLVGVTAIGDRGSWSYPINLGPLKCTRPPSSREGVRLSVLVPLFCGCQYLLVQLIIIVSMIVHSNSLIPRGFRSTGYIYSSPCLFFEIDSHEEVYLSRNVSSRNWSISGQFSSSCTNACSIGGSPGWIKSVILSCPWPAFVPSSLAVIWSTLICLKGVAAIVSDRLKKTGSER